MSAARRRPSSSGPWPSACVVLGWQLQASLVASLAPRCSLCCRLPMATDRTDLRPAETPDACVGDRAPGHGLDSDAVCSSASGHPDDAAVRDDEHVALGCACCASSVDEVAAPARTARAATPPRAAGRRRRRPGRLRCPRPLGVERAQRMALGGAEVPLPQCRVSSRSGDAASSPMIDCRLARRVRGRWCRSRATPESPSRSATSAASAATLRGEDGTVRLSLHEPGCVPGALTVAYEPQRVLVVASVLTPRSQCPQSSEPLLGMGEELMRIV